MLLSGVWGTAQEKVGFGMCVYFWLQKSPIFVHNTLVTSHSFTITMGMTVFAQIWLKSQPWRPKPEQFGAEPPKPSSL